MKIEINWIILIWIIIGILDSMTRGFASIPMWCAVVVIFSLYQEKYLMSEQFKQQIRGKAKPRARTSSRTIKR